jgi:hypothetical protein
VGHVEQLQVVTGITSFAAPSRIECDFGRRTGPSTQVGHIEGSSGLPVGGGGQVAFFDSCR